MKVRITQERRYVAIVDIPDAEEMWEVGDAVEGIRRERGEDLDFEFVETFNEDYDEVIE